MSKFAPGPSIKSPSLFLYFSDICSLQIVTDGVTKLQMPLELRNGEIWATFAWDELISLQKIFIRFWKCFVAKFFLQNAAFANLYNNTSGESSALQFLIQFNCWDLKCQNQKLWPRNRKCTKLKEPMLCFCRKKWIAWRFALDTWIEGQVFVSMLFNGWR